MMPLDGVCPIQQLAPWHLIMALLPDEAVPRHEQIMSADSLLLLLPSANQPSSIGPQDWERQFSGPASSICRSCMYEYGLDIANDQRCTVPASICRHAAGHMQPRQERLAVGELAWK